MFVHVFSPSCSFFFQTSKQQSVDLAFSRYIYRVVKCIQANNEALADEVTNDILSVTGGQPADEISSEKVPLVSMEEGTNGNIQEKVSEHIIMFLSYHNSVGSVRHLQAL